MKATTSSRSVVGIREGRLAAEMTGRTYRAAYCEVMIDGRPHTVDLHLIPGYSSTDHLADLPMAAMIVAVSGREYPTAGAVKKAMAAGRSAAAKLDPRMRGGPRIDAEITAGRLRDRWYRQAIDALRVQVERGGKVKGQYPDIYEWDEAGEGPGPNSHGDVYVKDGETRVRVPVLMTDGSGYRYTEIWRLDGSVFEPDGAEWSHVRDYYPS